MMIHLGGLAFVDLGLCWSWGIFTSKTWRCTSVFVLIASRNSKFIGIFFLLFPGEGRVEGRRGLCASCDNRRNQSFMSGTKLIMVRFACKFSFHYLQQPGLAKF